MGHLRSIFLALFSLVIGVSLLLTPSYGQVKPIELNYTLFQPAVTWPGKLAEDYAREIGQRTNGRVKVTVFPGGTLIAADKTYSGIVTGIADMGMSCMAYTRGKFPLSEVIDLPLGYKTGRCC